MFKVINIVGTLLMMVAAFLLLADIISLSAASLLFISGLIILIFVKIKSFKKI